MTDKEWAEKDYSYNTTRKKVLSTLEKMDKELDLMSSISACERRAINTVIDFITCRLELANVTMSKLQANDEQVKTNQWCKFKSEKNCDFCAFHSECEIRWREGDE